MTTAKKLEIYQRNLLRYEAEGNAEKVAIQKRLIERLRQDQAGAQGGQKKPPRR